MRAGDLLGGRYRLDDRIASGGMGTVWHGHDTTLGRSVAIKVLHPGLSHDENFRRRFHAEARVVGGLSAPGIVGIHDFGVDTVDSDGPVVYLVMELVAGEALTTMLQRRDRLPATETMRIVAACGDALETAHRAGITHRDIKPGNILLDQQGDVKIVDFGIARTTGDEGLTTTGVIMGTTPYIAPEQLRGDPPGPAGDIYSLGIVAYQCLAGRRPFESDVPATVITSALQDEPPGLPSDVPDSIAEVVLRALRKDPAERWQSAQAFADAARSSDIDPDATPLSSRVRPITPLPDLIADRRTAESDVNTEITPTKRRRPHRLGMVLTAAALVAGLAAAIAIIQPWQSSGADASANQASSSRGDQGQDGGGDDQDTSPSSADSTASDDPSTVEDETAPEPSTESTSPSPKPKEVTVPDVVGMHLDKAEEELGSVGLHNVGYSDGPKGCYVQSQYPNPDMEIKSDHYVELRLVPQSEKPCD